MKRPSIFILAIILSLSVSFSMAEPGDSLSIAHLKLRGTLFTRSLKPMAIIEDTVTGKVIMYEVGEPLEGGFKIADITRGEVSLKSEEGEYKLSFPQGAIWQPDLSMEEEEWYSIKKEGNIFVVDKATVSGAMRRVRGIMQNVRIKPCSVNGEKSGIMVTRLEKKGILKEIGVEEGDILKSVNGFTLNSPYQIFNAYRKLRDKEELKVDVIRHNQPILLTYKIQ